MSMVLVAKVNEAEGLVWAIQELCCPDKECGFVVGQNGIAKTLVLLWCVAHVGTCCAGLFPSMSGFLPHQCDWMQ